MCSSDLTELAAITAGQGTDTVTIASTNDADTTIVVNCEANDTATTSKRSLTIVNEHTLV